MPRTVWPKSIRVLVLALFLLPSAFLFVPHSAEAATTLSKPPNNLGLVGYWSFDEGTGTKATDFSGNGKTGTLINNPAWVNGKRGKALDFLAANGGVSISTIALGTTYTISVWVNPQTSDVTGCNGDICAIFAEAFTEGLIYTASGVVTLASGSAVSPVLPLNTWTHVVVSVNGGTDTMYINTVPISGGPGVPGFNANVISDSPNNQIFPGAIDEVRVYNRALSASEVAKLYGSGAVKFAGSKDLTRGSSLEQGLTGLWTLDGSDLTDKVYDRSGNNNHGYFNGGATSSAKTIGKLGQALSFDASNDFVLLGTTNILTGTESAFTICGWAYINSLYGEENIYARQTDIGSPTGTFLFDAAADGPGHYGVHTHSGDWNEHNATTPITLNAWNHLCATQSGGTISFYKDGVPDGSMGYVPPSSVGSLHQTIGGSYNNGSGIGTIDGKLDDVRIYNRALSPAEVQQLYHLGTVRVRP